jgi:hypothetical protein
VGLEVRDDYGNPVALGAAGAVGLAASPSSGVELFSDSACQLPSTVLALGEGQSAASFSLRATRSGQVLLTAELAPLAPAQRLQEIVAAGPERLSFVTAAQTLLAGECSRPVAVAAQDRYGNAARLGSPLPLALSASAPGVAFFGDAACLAARPSASLAVADARATFWLSGTVAGEAVISATTASGLEARQAERIDPAAPARLAFATGPQAVAAGACSDSVVVELRDRFGKPVPVEGALEPGPPRRTPRLLRLLLRRRLLGSARHRRRPEGRRELGRLPLLGRPGGLGAGLRRARRPGAGLPGRDGGRRTAPPPCVRLAGAAGDRG